MGIGNSISNYVTKSLKPTPLTTFGLSQHNPLDHVLFLKPYSLKSSSILLGRVQCRFQLPYCSLTAFLMLHKKLNCTFYNKRPAVFWQTDWLDKYRSVVHKKYSTEHKAECEWHWVHKDSSICFVKSRRCRPQLQTATIMGIKRNFIQQKANSSWLLSCRALCLGVWIVAGCECSDRILSTQSSLPEIEVGKGWIYY